MEMGGVKTVRAKRARALTDYWVSSGHEPASILFKSQFMLDFLLQIQRDTQWKQ